MRLRSISVVAAALLAVLGSARRPLTSVGAWPQPAPTPSCPTSRQAWWRIPARWPRSTDTRRRRRCGSGTRTCDYGAAPKGLLLIDGEGHYSLQLFRAERPRFATGNKFAGTKAGYKAAVLGSSTHFGIISVDAGAGTLTFDIDAASFPNWEGAA